LPRSIVGNLIKRVVQEVPGIRILALAMDDNPKVIKQVLASGALAVVVKATAGTDLTPAIQHVREGNQYVSPSVPI
jgi:DNA-binding NarL/FixJ family response regulator